MILVFGKAGQVGMALQKFSDVVALDRLQADLTSPQACSDAIICYNPAAVINAAAYTAVDKAEHEEKIVNIINGEAPGEMAKTCAKLKIPFVHISTDYVFDGTNEIEWKTTSKTNPQSVYGKSKLMAEEAIKGSGAIYAILRTSWVISENGDNFVKKVLKLSRTQKNFNIVDDQIGGPTPANDIAKACIEVAKQLIRIPSKSGIYHFTGAPNVSWYQFANTIFEQAAVKSIVHPISSSEYPSNVHRPKNSRLDCSQIEQVFNIRRPLWRKGLEVIIKELEKLNEKT